MKKRFLYLLITLSLFFLGCFDTSTAKATFLIDEYIISENIIKGISPNTSVEYFLSQIITNQTGDVYSNSEKKNMTDVISTGDTLQIPNEEYFLVVQGDASGDGLISSTDLLRLKRQIVGLEDYGDLNRIAMDLDSNTHISTTDVLQLKRCIVGLLNKITSAKFNHQNLEIKKDQSFSLDLIILPENTNIDNISYNSTNENVAKVNQNGLITAVNVGEALITANIQNEKIAKCFVTVSEENTNTSIPVTGIQLEQDNITINKLDTFTLTPVINPTTATNKTILWSSADESIARVNAKGVVTGLSAGTTTITATTQDGNFSASCTVTVNIPVTEIRLHRENITINKLEPYTLTYVVVPSNATNKTVLWSSADESIARVNAKGVVTGLSAGTTTITATTQDGNHTASCTVTVNIPVTELRLHQESITIDTGDTYTLNAVVVPTNATNKTVLWSSSDTSIARVNMNGIVTGLSSGTATITATTQDGGFTASCSVTVNPNIENIDIVENNLTIKLNNTIPLTLTVTPPNSSPKIISWESSNTDIISVNASGVIRGLQLGEATITATSTNGKTDTCKVKVIPTTDPIMITGKEEKKYKDNIIIYNPKDGSKTLFQDFDITNLGTSSEEYYFITTVRPTLPSVENFTEEQKKELLTAMVIKTNENTLSNITSTNSEIMYLDNAGQGQFITKEPNNTYFWVSGNGGIIGSGNGVKYENDTWIVTDASQCHWWGGNNADISRVNFTPNQYGNNYVIDQNYNYGTINQKRINIWTTFDFENNLMAVIDYVQDIVYVYDAQQAINGTQKMLYSFPLEKGNDVTRSHSTQGYAINGGYLYRLRGNYKQKMHIEVFDMYGNYVDYAEIDPGYRTDRQEAQGLKIYNNTIYFGFTYKHNLGLLDFETEEAQNPDAKHDTRNAIFYLE